ncbi:hypothetical protein BLNAU_7448 [Blattamonas nauphoetae]|uniref:Uncharacterized protein n=1 Tax=Blattamonas nauphoetae TaxID=2049346 RepID=A0ABQ9Y1L6_9EUKA|nr:hypothetical protein BLNAU_7448 [Blattamonas nauphoetae]
MAEHGVLLGVLAGKGVAEGWSLNPVLDDSLEAKAVKFLKSVDPDDEAIADAFFFITTAAMELIENLVSNCSPKVLLALVKADLIFQLYTNLHPLSLSFAEEADIHACLIVVISESVWLATPNGLADLGIEDGNEQQAVHETTFLQVLLPSEQYLCLLCANRFSIIDGDQSENFLDLLANLLQISPYYQPTLEIVLHMPVVLTIPSCLTFFEDDHSIWLFLDMIVDAQLEWNKKGGEVRQMGRIVQRMLRMEGIEDVIEAKLRNDQNDSDGEYIVLTSNDWNNQLGMNLPEQE